MAHLDGTNQFQREKRFSGCRAGDPRPGGDLPVRRQTVTRCIVTAGNGNQNVLGDGEITTLAR